MDAEAWNFWNDASLIGFVIAVGPEPLVGLPSLHCFNFNKHHHASNRVLSCSNTMVIYHLVSISI
jgi:hypothetical protein